MTLPMVVGSFLSEVAVAVVIAVVIGSISGGPCVGAEAIIHPAALAVLG